jgi:hypothetical protein
MNCLTAAELNNLGAMHLQSGHLRTSLNLFRDALSLTLLDLEAEQRSSCCSDMAFENESRTALSSSQANDNVQACSASPNSASRGNSCTEEVESDCPQFSPSSTAFVQAQAINVIPLPNAYSHDPLVNMTIVSSIVLFNLGIVYHLKGLEGTNESSSYLVKSCSLYQKSQVLLADSGVPLNCTGNPVIDILSMAINNNLAQVFFELAMYDDSRQHFEQLIAFAVTVVPARYGDLAIGNLIDEQKSKFLLNAMILHAPKLAPAA